MRKTRACPVKWHPDTFAGRARCSFEKFLSCVLCVRIQLDVQELLSIQKGKSRIKSGAEQGADV